MTRLWLTVAVLVATLVGGCTYSGFGSLYLQYGTFKVPPPKDRIVYVCHAYGCRMQAKFRFTDQDIADLTTLMAKTKAADTPAEERRAVAYAIGWIERRVGD